MEKSAEAFRTISEVSDLLNTPAHVLRFWESRFTQVKPVKRAGGRRYYRPADLALLGGIKRLLHDDGMTIRGVQKVLRERGVRHVAALFEVGFAPDVREGDHAPPERRAPATVTPLWPASPAPETAAEGDMLLPDPDDLAGDFVGEAPMAVDAEPETEEATATLHRFGRGGRAADAAPGDDSLPRSPAAALLRAMDALRAQDKRAELEGVHDRLQSLRDRIARSDGGTRN